MNIELIKIISSVAAVITFLIIVLQNWGDDQSQIPMCGCGKKIYDCDCPLDNPSNKG